MFSPRQSLSDRQVNSFISFLIDGTDKAIIALEEVFGLAVDSSDSDIELAPLSESQFLQNLGDGTLYIMNSNMSGDLEGNITLMLRSSDFRYLGDVMKPVLNLMFLADPDTDLESLEQEKPDWLQSKIRPLPDDESFQRNMMDLLSELANVLIGRYSKSLYQIFHLSTHHTIPTVRPAPMTEALSGSSLLASNEAMHIVIENEFLIDDRPIKIWCLISPSQQSFPQLLGETRH
jgi:chemotaxis protein CheY-P-specific phosphatase CheC